MTSAKHPLRLVLLTLGAALSLSCAAQDDSHATREREALRRTQAALRQAQEQQAALAREKDDLAGQRDKLDEAAKRSQGQLAAARSDATRLNASLSRAAEELAAAQARDDAARKDLEARLAEQSQRLAESLRVADERARSNAALIGLLEHATQSLAAAETANREMHALGLQMIARIRDRQAGADAIAADPVLGFGQIRLENEAEALRDRLDAAKLANAARTPGAAK
jgi:septal ring factor EnvC (AmiA/AmiB activator)